MKVLLIKDVKGKGKAGDVITVSDGYGSNYLIKNGLAQVATNANINLIEGKKASDAHKKEVELQNAKDLAEKIEAQKVDIYVSVGSNGKLFGAINAGTIASELESSTGIVIDKKKIVLGAPIKTVGMYDLAVKLHVAVTAKLKVQIIAK